MTTRFSEEDDWRADGEKITAPEILDTIRQCLDESSIIIEHWFYRGSHAPDRMMFDDYDAFIEYLKSRASPGDAIHVWSFAAVCCDNNELARGKCPDDKGLVPRRGAY